MLELFSLILLFSLYNSEALISISDLFGSNEKDDYIFLKYYKNPENETKEFNVLKELKILLDISDIPDYSKVYFGYNWEYSLEDSIKAYCYTDKKLVDNTEGEKLDINKDNDCIHEKIMCEDFYRKMGHSMRYIVLKISPLKNNYNDSHKITIKY